MYKRVYVSDIWWDGGGIRSRALNPFIPSCLGNKGDKGYREHLEIHTTLGKSKICDLITCGPSDRHPVESLGRGT